jgi:hypothetical protein
LPGTHSQRLMQKQQAEPQNSVLQTSALSNSVHR